MLAHSAHGLQRVMEYFGVDELNAARIATEAKLTGKTADEIRHGDLACYMRVKEAEANRRGSPGATFRFHEGAMFVFNRHGRLITCWKVKKVMRRAKPVRHKKGHDRDWRTTFKRRAERLGLKDGARQ